MTSVAAPPAIQAARVTVKQDAERAEAGDDDGDLLPARVAPRERRHDGRDEARVEDQSVRGRLGERAARAVVVDADRRVGDVAGHDERLRPDLLEHRGQPEVAAEGDERAEQDLAVARLAVGLRRDEEEHEAEQAQPVEQREADLLELEGVRDQRRADRVDRHEREQPVDRPGPQRVGRADALSHERRDDRRADQEPVERDRRRPCRPSDPRTRPARGRC